MTVARARVRDLGHPVTLEVPEGVSVDAGQTLLMEVERGTSWAVATGRAHTPPEFMRCCERPTGAVTRVADGLDLDRVQALRRREAEALAYCRERARALGLSMKVADMEGVLSEKHLLCTFTADARVDFRQLVKDLGHRFHCHVRMHQIPPREEARRMGGIGPCGRALCCASFLHRPPGVRSRQARHAAPGSASAKRMGLCGKLKCCLAYEGDGEEARDTPTLVRLS